MADEPKDSASGDTGASADDTGDGDTGALNQQIVQAVDTANTTVLDAAGQEGTAMAFQKVSQATAFAVQDATDYMRNVMAMSMTAQGIAFKLMIEHKEEADDYAKIVQHAADAVVKAQTAFKDIGTSAGDIANSFPKGK